ncbi:MAG: hypothetical protein CM15mP89_5270 [Gammaproteobacteria bacterium]|nr:MAG: hypothetical protein CM15mP89_5270 [Gammaproteobacteria bacterium]
MAEKDLATAPGSAASICQRRISDRINMIVGAERDMITDADHPRCMEWVARMKALPVCPGHRKDGRESMALTY